MSAAENVNDVINCPICLEDLENPRSLPCLHTFCFKCLEGTFRQSVVGDDVSCPMCRKEFTIPAKGLEGLPHNFFLDRLVQGKKMSTGGVLCEVCSAELDGEAASNIPTATTYCVDCEQQLCERCSMPHRRMRGGAHEVKPLDKQLQAELIQLRSSACEHHKGQLVEMYCLECKANICVRCFADEHKTHDCQKIATVADEFKKQMETGTKMIIQVVADIEESSAEVKLEKAKLLKNILELESEVRKKGEAMKRRIDASVRQLMDDLVIVKDETRKEMESWSDGLSFALTAMNSFIAYSSEMSTRGKPSDITRAAGGMIARAEELMKSYADVGKYRTPIVTVVPFEFDKVVGEQNNLIGEVMTQKFNVETWSRQSDDSGDSTSKDEQQQKVACVIQEHYEVCGATVLENELFVFRNRPTEQLAVYYTEDYSVRRSITVPNVKKGCVVDVASCPRNRCLYIADEKNKLVHRMEQNGTTASWKVKDRPAGISVTPGYNVLVTFKNRVLNIHSTLGEMLREIKLSADVANPRHAVEMPAGNFVVAGGKILSLSESSVYLVDASGTVIRKYFGYEHAGAHFTITIPKYLAVDKNQNIFVLTDDFIAVFSSELQYLHQFGKHKFPSRMCLDLKRNQIWVVKNLIGASEITCYNCSTT